MTDAVEQPTAPPPAPTPVEGAQARLSQLTADKVWSAKFVGGDVATRAEFNDLTTLAAGLEKRPGAEELQAIFEKESNDRHIAIVLKGVRESGLNIRDEVLKETIAGTPVSQRPRHRKAVDGARVGGLGIKQESTGR